jgi:hypothetical protein
MTSKVCSLCGDVLQPWEIDYHADCAERDGLPEPEFNLGEWADERIERDIQRDEMLRRPTVDTKQKTVHELTNAEIEEWSNYEHD